MLPRKADSKRWLWLFASADHKLLHRAGEHHNPDCLRMATRKLYVFCGNPNYNLVVRNPPFSARSAEWYHCIII